jgi:hypothetical protein
VEGTIDEVRAASNRTIEEIQAINRQLINPNRLGEDGHRMDSHAYWEWHKRAVTAKISKEEQQRLLRMRLHELQKAQDQAQRAHKKEERTGIFVPLWDGMTCDQFLLQAEALYERLVPQGREQAGDGS